jgi:hypothetical protein
MSRPTDPPELLAQVAALRALLGPAPELRGLTASTNGIEWDDMGVARVDDVEEFVATYGLPCLHSRAAGLVAEDRDGVFSSAWQDAVDEWTRDAADEEAHETYVEWRADRS